MKGDARKARIKAEKQEEKFFKETSRRLVIAGLVVMTNAKIPDGVMVVSPKEGERLGEMVAKATTNATLKKPEAENDDQV